MDTPRACPNFGVDCDYPNCTFLEAECATANAPPLDARAHAGDGDSAAREAGAEPQVVRVVPPSKPGEMPTLFPISADEIFKR